MANKYYATQTNRTLNLGSLPTLSHNLESFRAYQWEVEIDTPDGGIDETLTLAAKQISEFGFTSEVITADRVNDKFYYPGKVTTDEVTITFDNLVKDRTAEKLYDWMSSVYNPVTGTFTQEFRQGLGSFKRDISIYQLDNTMIPVKHTRLYGAFPNSWKMSELNYATNEFHTLQCSLRYDFVVQYKDYA